VFINTKPCWGKGFHAFEATDQVENAATIGTEEKVVVVPGGAFVVRRDPRDVNEAGAAIFDKLFNSAVNGSDAERRDMLFCNGADFLRGEGAVGGFEDFREYALLLSRVCHEGSLPAGGQASRPYQEGKRIQKWNFAPRTQIESHEVTKSQKVITNAWVHCGFRWNTSKVKSQRRFIVKPWVARNEQAWVS